MIKVCKCPLPHRFNDYALPEFYKCAFCGDVLIGTAPATVATAAPITSTLPTDPGAGVFALNSDIEANAATNMAASASSADADTQNSTAKTAPKSVPEAK